MATATASLPVQKITMRTTAAGGSAFTGQDEKILHPGKSYLVPGNIAKEFIDGGYAVPFKPEVKPVKAIEKDDE